MTAVPCRLNASGIDECLKVRLGDLYVTAKFRKRDPSLGNEPSDEPRGSPESLSRLVDRQQ